MKRRSTFMVLAGAGFVIAGLAALGGRSATPAAAPLQGASQSPVTPTPIVGSPSVAAVANASPIANCLATSQLVAVRSVVPATGFPTPIEWADPGPQAGLFFTLSDVAPTIPLLPAGPVVLTIGLSFSIAGDRYAFTASAVTLTYEAATGLVSGTIATGYGKNTNRATTDAGPSPFKGRYERTGPGIGVFSGSVMHPARTFAFRVQMTEKTIPVLGPGCASPRPSDRP